MKKILVIIMGTILLVGVTACGKENTDDNGKGNISTHYFDIFSSNNYHMKASVMEGNVERTMEVYVKDEKISTTVTFEGETSRMITLKNRTYFLMDEEKLMNMAPIVIKEGSGIIDTGNLIEGPSGTERFNNKELTYDEYTESTGNKIRFFTENDRLVGIRIVSKESTENIVIEVLDQNVPDSVFKIPTDYELIDY